MNLVPYSWNGNLINDWKWNGTNIGEWSSEFPVGERANLAATGVFSPVAYAFPHLSTTQVDGHYISITFHPKSKITTVAAQREQLKQWFAIGRDFTPHQLIAQDTEDVNRQWYLTGIPVAVQQVNIGEYVVTLALTDPVWRIVTQSTTGNLVVNASPRTDVLRLKGNVSAPLIITIQPVGARTGSFLYKRYVPIYNPNKYAFPFAASTVEVTNGGLDTASLILAGKMLATGDDARLYVDGNEVYRWFGATTHAINTAVTFIWANIPHSAGQIGTLLTALPNNGTAVNVTFNKTAANLAVLKALANVVNKAFIIDSEIFTFTKDNVDLTNYQIKNCSRAQKTTAFAAHSTNANITWIEHDVWLVYGNSAALPPDLDNTQKPMIDLDASTNASWVWSQFFDSTAVRPGEWSPQVVASSINKLANKLLTNYYTGNQTAFADPATELGLQMSTDIINGVQKAETAFLQWTFSHPAGFTTASMSGQKFLFAGTIWPSVAGLFVSNNNVSFTKIWNETIPPLNAWTAFTHAAVALGGTFKYILLQFHGSIAAKPSNQAAIQGDTVTLALGTGRITTSLLAEVGNYQITATIRDNDSGEEIYINATVRPNQILTIDCNAKTVTLDDGTNMFGAISFSSGRKNPDWLNAGLDVNGNFLGTATMIYTEPGVTNENITYSWNDSAL